MTEPTPGLVIRHSYLWYREHRAARDQGRKDRPTAILMTAITETKATRVYVLPITHTPPSDADVAIEIPSAVKSRIGLDSQRSWIVLDELNDFIWPGFDLAAIPGSDPPAYSYGVLPPRFYVRIRDAFLQLYDQRRVRSVNRD